MKLKFTVVKNYLNQNETADTKEPHNKCRAQSAIQFTLPMNSDRKRKKTVYTVFHAGPFLFPVLLRNDRLITRPHMAAPSHKM